jgi:hypothetical protein
MPDPSTVRPVKLKFVAAVVVAVPLFACATHDASQGDVAVPLAQVEARYPRMSYVHIIKCDKNGDQLYSRIELSCVRSVYHAMYIEE